MSQAQITAGEIKKQISKNLVDVIECMQLLHPITNTSKATTISNTKFANASIRIRDALIHEAILGLTKILDADGSDRLCLAKLIKRENRIDLEEELSKVKSSEEWLELKAIRDGRISHSLIDPGSKLAFDWIYTIKYKIIDFLEKIDSTMPIISEHKALTGEWNKIAHLFWSPIANAAIIIKKEKINA